MINSFLKKLDKRNKVLDFKKITDEGFLINIIISERGAVGKTFGAKEFLLDRFVKYGEESVWVVSTKEIIKSEIANGFLTNNKLEFPEKWKDVKRIGTRWFYKNKRFLKIIALSTAENDKGGRNSMIKWIFYDEFTLGLKVIGKRQFELLYNLMNTYSDVMKESIDLKVFIFGNHMTANIPLLSSLNISDTSLEFSNKIINGSKLWLMYVPYVDQKIADSKYAKNQIYQLGKLTGDADHSFLNKNLYDIDLGVVGIKTIEEIEQNNFHYISTLCIDNSFLEVYFNPKEKLWFYKGLRKKKLKFGKNYSKIQVGRKKDLQPFYQYNKKLKDIIISSYGTHSCTFDTITSKYLMDKIING